MTEEILAATPVDPAVAPGASAAADAPGRTRRAPALSPSRTNDYVQCPLLFRFRTVDRLPEPPSQAAARGTLVHAVLENLFDAPSGERTSAAAHALVPGAWQKLLHERPEYSTMFADADEAERWLGTAGPLLDTYFTLEDPNWLEPRARELLVEVELEDGPRLRGIVDRVDVAPDGAVRIVDYKTGKSPRPQYGASAAFQMRFYGLVVWRTRQTVPAMLQLMYLGDGQVLRSVPSIEDLERAETRIRSVWSSIVRDAEAEDFAPSRSRLCDWCAHRSLCPAFGGQAPEIPEGAIRLNLGLA